MARSTPARRHLGRDNRSAVRRARPPRLSRTSCGARSTAAGGGRRVTVLRTASTPLPARLLEGDAAARDRRPQTRARGAVRTFRPGFGELNAGDATRARSLRRSSRWRVSSRRASSPTAAWSRASCSCSAEESFVSVHDKPGDAPARGLRRRPIRVSCTPTVPRARRCSTRVRPATARWRSCSSLACCRARRCCPTTAGTQTDRPADVENLVGRHHPASAARLLPRTRRSRVRRTRGHAPTWRPCARGSATSSPTRRRRRCGSCARISPADRRTHHYVEARMAAATLRRHRGRSGSS